MDLKYEKVEYFPHVFTLDTEAEDWMTDCVTLVKWCQKNVAAGDWKQGYTNCNRLYKFRLRNEDDAFKFRMMFCG